MYCTSTLIGHFESKPLPYDYSDLTPAISDMTLRLHHDKHYNGYLTTLNRLIVDTRYEKLTLEEVVLESKEGAIFNNAAQVWNHEFYFAQLSATPQRLPTGALLEAINSTFGSYDEFVRRTIEACTSLFGSGWVWLVIDQDDRLSLVKESNAGNPITRSLRPLLTIDVWEHAYYCDYQNRRADAVSAHLEIIDWAVIEKRYEKK